MPKDGAKARSFSKKASPKRSTIKCVRHPGRTRRATNQSHNSRAQPARGCGRMLSELAPVITTTLSLIPRMKFCFCNYRFSLSIRQRPAPLKACTWNAESADIIPILARLLNVSARNPSFEFFVLFRYFVTGFWSFESQHNFRFVFLPFSVSIQCFSDFHANPFR